MGCSVSHSKRKEKGRAYLEDALIAGKGLGEDTTNGAAARPVVAAGEGRARRRESERRESFKKQKGGDEPEREPGGLSTSRAGAARAEVALSMFERLECS